MILALLVLTGCAELMKTLQTVSAVTQLTEADIVGGLKEALTVGARNAAGRLAAQDGYWVTPQSEYPSLTKQRLLLTISRRFPEVSNSLTM